MALISCSDCRKDISDKAHGCPHCGLPYKGKGLHRRFSHGEILVIVLVPFLAWYLIPAVLMLLV